MRWRSQAAAPSREQLDKPPNARGLIIEYRTLLWRDLPSIRNASIAEPVRQDDIWRVCVRLDIKGSLGAYTGERDYVVALYGVAKRPELLMEDSKLLRGPPRTSRFPNSRAAICGRI